MHIVTGAGGAGCPGGLEGAVVGGDAVAVRLAWEREQVRRLVDQQRRAEEDLAARDRAEARAEEVLGECERRLRLLLDSLEPYVDGTAGELTAGMAAVYERAVGRLAELAARVAWKRRPVTPLPVWPEPVRPGDGVDEVRVVEAMEVSRAVVAGQLAEVRERLAGARLELEG